MRLKAFGILSLFACAQTYSAISEAADINNNILVTALTSSSRKFVEFSVENLNDFDVKCKFISVKAQYYDVATSLDLGFRPVVLRDLSINAGDRVDSVESGKDVIAQLQLTHPQAEIKTLNYSDADIRYNCEENKPAQPDLPPEEPEILQWEQLGSTDVTINAGQDLPYLAYKAKGPSSINYTFGHPTDECSWDNPHVEGDRMVVSGRAPTGGTYTLNGKTLQPGNNVCYIRVQASDGTTTLAQDLKITIANAQSAMKWIQGGDTGIIWADAGAPIQAVNFQAWSPNGKTITYSHGHPTDECSWDRPVSKGMYLELSGTPPASGFYTLNKKSLVQGYNVCNIRIVAQDGANTLTKDVQVYIYHPGSSK